MTDKKAPTAAESAFLQEQEDGGYVVDMTQVPEAKNEVLPKSTYVCTIDEGEYKLSASAGLPMWALVYVITEGEYEGRKLFHNVSFSEKALPFSKRTLARMCPEVLTADFRPQNFDDYDIVGRNIRVKTKIGKDQNGEKRTEVAEVVGLADTSAFMGAPATDEGAAT